MPRTTIAAAGLVTPKGPAPGTISAGDLTVVPQAADVANKNQFSPSPGDILMVQNTGASPYTFTLTSAPDVMKRTGDIATYSLAAAEIALFHYGDLSGWKQADGFVYLEASNASVKFLVIHDPQ